MKEQKLAAVIFDLDGVITDTARFHYQAWKEMADREGIYFDEEINERLKGVSRMDSLHIILERAARAYTHEEKETLCQTKNDLYNTLLDTLTAQDILPGILSLFDELHDAALPFGVYSVSKNTGKILRQLGITGRFHTIVCGLDITRSKPDPEGFLLAADKLGVPADSCLVVEDAYAGLEGARAAGMKSVGVGDPALLTNATKVVSSTAELNLSVLRACF